MACEREKTFYQRLSVVWIAVLVVALEQPGDVRAVLETGCDEWGHMVAISKARTGARHHRTRPVRWLTVAGSAREQPGHEVGRGLRPAVMGEQPLGVDSPLEADTRRERADGAAEEIRSQREVLQAPDEHSAQARIGPVGADVVGDHPRLEAHPPGR